MELSISQLSDLTGRDRRTITRKLEKLDHSDGPKGAHLYDSEHALAAIYLEDGGQQGSAFDQARTQQALESAALTRVRREAEEKKRPPLELVLGFLDAIGQEVAAQLKVHKGKTLDQVRIDELFRGFRELAGNLVKAKGVSW